MRVPEAATRLFVYGTLMPGGARWPALRPYATAWEPATAPGRLWDTGRGYPAVRFDPDGGPIRGFLVAIAPELAVDAIAVLDVIEAEGVLYRRVEVVTSAGPAFGYEWLGSTEGLAGLADGWPCPPG
ncbi:MAG: gamma-glutamylcyclotransferase [Actinomycetota bacterium]|nr:gamma-glutamylcyclotransferase [Actinomycetota bacterium]